MFNRLKASIGKTFYTWARLGMDENALSNQLFGMDKDVILSYLNFGTRYREGQYDYYNNRKELLANFRGWAFLVADKYAKAVMECSDKWGLYYDTATGDKLVKSSYLYDLRNNCDPASEILDYKTVAATMYLGNAHWYTPLNEFGKPAEINFIEPSWGTMQVVKTTKNEIVNYLLKPDYAAEPIAFDKNKIIHFYYPSISSGDYGRAPSNYIKSTFELDAKYNTFSNSMVDNGSVPPFAVQFPRPLIGEQRENIELALKQKGGIRGSGQALILDNGAVANPLFTSPKDMDFMEGKKMNRDEAFQINSIPKSVAGVSEDVNRSSADAGIYVFYRLGLAPFLKLYAGFETRGLFNKYDPRIKKKYDNVIPEDEKLQAEVDKIMIDSGMATPDQLRAERGQPPYPDGIGSKPFLSRNLATMKDVVDGKVGVGAKNQDAQNQDTNNP